MGLLLGAFIAVVNLVLFSAGLNIKYVVFVASALIAGFVVQRALKHRGHQWMYMTISLAGASFIYWVYPNIFVDDTGFVVRYMEMAREGCFYCYNKSDGAIFGLSSFIYGVVTLLLAKIGLASNEAIINAVNFIGLTVLLYFLLNTFWHITKNHFYVITSVALVVMSATQFQFASTVGLETNFHLAIVIAGIYYFFLGNRRWMWLLFALSVISKLDTVPLITILSLIHLWENRSDYFGENWQKNWAIGFTFAGIPILLFMAFTYVMFDGPLPQSAYSKIYYHTHPSDHWFPFLELMLEHDNRAVLVGFSVLILVLHLIFSFAKRQFKFRDFALFLGFVATMALFYFYNPVERMSWYYAMPELLLYSQLLLSTYSLSTMYGFKESKNVASGGFALMFAALSIISVPMTTSEKTWTDKYMKAVERERLDIGAYIAELPAIDTLVSAHGHFGAYYDGYVLDLSGLNSKLATDHAINPNTILSKFRPKYFIHHANDNLVGIAEDVGYEPLKEWVNIEYYGYPKWVLWKRVE
jgi:hypothetical protein